jgi:phosphate transport system substrate-binding protein
MPASVGITSELNRNEKGIGYDGLGYVTANEKMVAVAPSPEGPYVLPSVETAKDGSYLLSRPLFMYTAGEPHGEIAVFLDWVRGPAGQEIVRELGFVPVPEGDTAARPDGQVVQ